MYLTKHEQEKMQDTIIRWNLGKEMATIITFEKALQCRLLAVSLYYPDECWLESQAESGGMTFIIRRSRLSLTVAGSSSKKHLEETNDEANAQNHQNPESEAETNGSES